MLEFKNKDLLPVFKEASEKKCSILLVKDYGIYFMPSDGEFDDNTGRVKNIAYAQDCHPDDADWHDLARFEAGGDDFGEEIDLMKHKHILTAVLEQKKDLYVEFTDETYSITYDK